MALPRTTDRVDYPRLALADPDGGWELWAGVPRGKPPMSVAHNWVVRALGRALDRQLDEAAFVVQTNLGRVLWAEGNAFIPDVMVVPIVLARHALAERPDALESYAEPLPFIAEVWSPSTGGYDIRVKLAAYQERGDAEIWRLHPFDRTLTRWLRQDDGAYLELVHTGGIVELAALPGVAIDLDALFAP
jgi:Uma2 family endonuclease